MVRSRGLASFCDLDGPYQVYVPGHERDTGSRKVIVAKCYIMMFACPVTKLVNLQVIEAKSAEAVLEGLTRLGCDQGFPHFLVLDQETSFMKAVRESEIILHRVQAWNFFILQIVITNPIFQVEIQFSS